MKYQCSFKSAKDMAQYIKAEGIELIDAVFCDPLGLWHHCTFCPNQVEEDDIKDGLPFDGSSIRLFCSIENSDMAMVPDPSSCWIDPFCDRKTLHVTCSIKNPQTNQGFARDPRSVAARCLEFVKKEGIADTIIIGPEAEFFIFDDVKYGVSNNEMFFKVDGVEGYWNTGSEQGGANLAHRVPPKNWYFPVPPIDTTMNLRGEMLLTMGDMGVPIEKHHHEVATCQSELGFTCRPMIECADMLMTYKYVIKNVARKYGKTATFMPKPIFGDNGTGMHVHQSLWKDGKPLFFDENGKYVKLSQMCTHYIGGLLKHAPAVLAFTNPAVNSYKRLVPGFEAPVNLCMSKGNRSAAVRIPMYKPDNPKQKRLEFRCPDPSCCPYLAFAAMVMAGIDGIKNKIEPPPPCDFDIYELSEEEKAKMGLKSTPGSLAEALDALEADHSFLTAGGVFTEDFIQAYIEWKRNEYLMVATLPHPKEYELYFQC
ncbi:unnamed protein product [Vitrella brassicaformis CCMP3155]|uniref:Glutamine synthetase n=1 Tax=Vitrella brassicaformis (strain CCMP3155) TaxID=1169540 RepID=A0A0G4GIN3_VITBC|nr:unnamed protein product [Vitrella brassicaformis CCMP3155]|mmetsp:Transcript_29313/g.84814  ORF Transcript_29313/g.84814 Transcript_29313/m.84814 type:complete len:482 (-) Transcript_29313:1230-2675(-)|eukprot:CEM29696.1 unnamed protein product [Vitrella brassicaformis CCMP3155]